MSRSMRDLIDGEAMLDDEEDDESFADEDGDGESTSKRKEARVDDSSEEDDDLDEDEEEAQRIRDGFIVDEDEEEEEEEDNVEERPRHRQRSRPKRSRDEELDEEDLDLIGEAHPEWERKPQPQQSKYKRLKRGHGDDERGQERRGLDLFSDEDDDMVDERQYGRQSHRAGADEFDDFIEEDYPEDDEERNQRQEDMEVARPRDRGLVVDAAGLGQETLDDMEAIFGNGEEYDWALQMEEEEEDLERKEQPIELKDVFEPSQLKERLLTDEDNEIRIFDEPERFQLDRKPFKNLQMEEQFREEARWITNLMWPKKQLHGDLHGPFNKAVGKVLEFFIIDGVEVPYVFQHRRDYLIHAKKIRTQGSRDDPDAPEYTVDAEKLLTQDDLWRILELDIKFRSLVEKRNALEATIRNLKANADVQDDMLEDMVRQAATIEELQDLQDYINFQYSGTLKEIAARGNGVTREMKRPGAKTALFDRIRKSNVYNFVRALGISPDRLAQNALREGKKAVSDDDAKLPMDLADSLADHEFPTGEQVINAARQMYAEEMYVSPRMRKHFRINYYQMGWVSCKRTEKGLRKIDESHPYYEVKYLTNQTIRDLAARPEIFLKMMKAEEEGLLEVKLTLENEREFQKQLYAEFASENFSDLADAWNRERKQIVNLAFAKLEKVITKGVKDSLRTACQEELLKTCREEYFKRLDQAPLKPKGMMLGTTPRVLTLSNGMGDYNRDPIFWTWVEEDGRVVEHGKFLNLGRSEEQREAFAELVRRRGPDAIGVAGFSADTHRLIKELENIISDKGLTGPEWEDPDTNDYRNDALEVIVVNDEVARLYQNSPRGLAEHPTLASVTRYCIALARYMQNPMKEYAALGQDVTSLRIHPYQQYLPQDKLYKHLETAMVDMVNLVGVDINDAMGDPYTANLLPYVSGLGPRKASLLIKGINANGGAVASRDELVGDPERHKVPVLGPRVWNNCASFLFIEYDATNPDSDPLDNTRIHPEDYDLARKVAADALGLDEEDVKAETDENGPGAVVRKLFREEEQEKVNELILEEYAEQLETEYQQRKRATLETIRAELQVPYEELRKNFAPISTDQIFTMCTGETRESLCEGMIVPVNVRVVKDDFAIVKLDCGIEGRIEAHEVSHRHSLKDVFATGQTVQAKILDLNRKDFICKLTMREEEMRRPYRKHQDHDRGQWDYRLEDQDREELREKDKTTGRTQRVVKHPLFKPFNGTQAEEYLGGQPAGEVVIRPSSKGNDHLAVTWKVADGIYQHIDVLELQKENEFSVGKTLRVGGKYNYSDLDELIVEHVKAMAKKVDELMRHDKFRAESLSGLEKFLNVYVAANPTRSAYFFCLDTKHAGYFYLCYKASPTARFVALSVRIIPNAYELAKNQYPDMRALCNGFKLRFASARLPTMAGIEQLEIHSKSYIVRWVQVDEGHTISWSVQPHKKSINFAIVKHPGTGGTTFSSQIEGTATPDQQTEGTADPKNGRFARRDVSTAQDQLAKKGFIPIKWYGKCEADKVCVGTYDVTSGGMFGLVFDNTFSKQTSKTATFVLLTYPTGAPPQTARNLPNLQAGPNASSSRTSLGKHSSPRLGAAATDSVDSLHSHHAGARGVLASARSDSSGSSSYHVGTLLKRRRKKGQGYARRFFSLDYTTCTLSYYHNRNSSALRGAIPLSLAAIAADERRREITIDSGAEVWHLKASNAKEFNDWARALERASRIARGLETLVSETIPERAREPQGVSAAGATHPEEDREWQQVESLVSRIVGTRDALRRLVKDMAVQKHASNSHGSLLSPGTPTVSEESDGYFTPQAEKRPFWKRKASASSPLTPQTFQSAVNSSLAVPTPTGASLALPANGGKKSYGKLQEERNTYDHCSALLSDLDSVVVEFSNLLSSSKRRRLPAPAALASRQSIESTSTEEFFDAEAGDIGTSNQLMIIEHQSEEDTAASDAEEVDINDSSSVSSIEDEEEYAGAQGAAGLFPMKPKSLTPLPIPDKVRRRKTIPPSKVAPPSLIAFVRKNVGKDLSTISMPVSANEPTSLLQRVAEQLEYAQLLDKAAQMSHPRDRLLYVTAFAISQFSGGRAKERAIRKPFNPLLGETFELVRSDAEVPGGFRLLVEKVSHRPVRLAMQADSALWSFAQSPAPSQKFWGKSAEITTEGRVRVSLRVNGGGEEEFYSWNIATVFLRNVVMGEKYVEPVGTMHVANESTGAKAAIEFRSKGVFGGRGEDVQVELYGPDGGHMGASLTGTWTGGLKAMPSGEEVWRVGSLVENAANTYGMTTFAASLNEVTELERGRLPPTDTRLRPDQRMAEEGDLDGAEEWKVRLEEAQRERRRVLEERGEEYRPRWFVRVEGTGGDGTGTGTGEEVWRLKGGKEGYWEERARGGWAGAVDIFGV
ncbi:Oxysterol-binding protein-domain-containing protein [Echria macrotheca]|uniref:Transcription elongation factor SPT6 n=1 Tax=Echria macrotheca TaxID=438768 RepID=A0AAJ0F0C8_9PEZI|nr:Oxysterol-binding protein-domain-containing protein [Echria macrotheca]